MKKMKTHELIGHTSEYVLPGVSIIEIESEHVLCGSGWNDGSIQDDEDDWNVIPTI